MERERFVCMWTTKGLLRVFKQQEAHMPSFLQRDDTHKVRCPWLKHDFKRNHDVNNVYDVSWNCSYLLAGSITSKTNIITIHAVPPSQTNYVGLPVEQPGTTYLNNKFHTCGMILKSHEDTAASLHVNHVITEGCYKLLRHNFNPTNFMSDHSWAFTNANRNLRSCKGDFADEGQDGDDDADGELGAEAYGQHGICFAHMMSKTETVGKGKMVDVNRLGELKRDLRALHDLGVDEVNEPSIRGLMFTLCCYYYSSNNNSYTNKYSRSCW
jgi:hypothetical protein